MHYNMTTPCPECPFLNQRNMRNAFPLQRLKDFASGEFACHQACDPNEDDEFEARGDDTPHCAGALIFNEKRNSPTQMMRICERIGMYDRRKLSMTANVR